MKQKNTCIDPDVCTTENCRFVGDDCDQEYWKLLISEGIQVGEYQYSDIRPGLTFSKDDVNILYVFHASKFGEEEIRSVRPSMVPPSLLELLRQRDITQLVRKTYGRLSKLIPFI